MLRPAMAVALALGCVAVAAQDADPIKTKLEKAKAAYEAEARLYREGVRDWFAKREEPARAKGDKKAIDAIKVESVAFEETGGLPKTAPQALRTRDAAARKAIAAAYAEAIRDYTKAKKDAEASAVETEFKSIAPAAVTPPATGGKPPAVPVGVRPPGENPCATPAKPVEGAYRRHQTLVETAKSAGPVDVVFLGDTICQRWETTGRNVWTEKVVPLKPLNVAINGERTEHTLWRLTEGKMLGDLSPKVIVVQVGTENVDTNLAVGNTPEQVAGGVRAVVMELRKQKPNAKILLFGLFPRIRNGVPPAEIAPAGMLHPKVKAANAILARLHNGVTIRYVDIGDRFLDKGGNLPKRVMSGYKLPTEEGYQIWADAMAKPLAEMLKE